MSKLKKCYFFIKNKILTKHPPVSTLPIHLVNYLKKVKNDGYAYESGEYHFDEVCYCAPILNNGKAIATLSIYGHKSYLNKFHKQDIIEDLLDISKTISDLISNH